MLSCTIWIPFSGRELTLGSTMSVRRFYIPIAIFLPTLFQASSHADDTLSYDEIIASVGELISIIAPSYDCEISDYVISSGPESDESYYLVKAKSSGARCDEALHMLNYRGRPQRVSFIFVEDDPGPNPFEGGGDGSQDLIHEIDPKGAT